MTKTIEADACIHDEVSQTSAILFHARQYICDMKVDRCADSLQTVGKIFVFTISGDYLQLPPVPIGIDLLARLKKDTEVHEGDQKKP